MGADQLEVAPVGKKGKTKAPANNVVARP
jgi:hypothetical protein